MNMRGLNSSEVKVSREKYGANTIDNKKSSFISHFLESLGDPIIKILLILIAVKTVFLFQDFDWFETLGVLVAILVASIISVVSEYGCNKVIEKMQATSARVKCKVLRDAKLEKIDLSMVVVGDIVVLQSGDIVPADGILTGGRIVVDESSFKDGKKDVEKKPNSEVFRGSVVLNGHAIVEIQRVGSNTKYSKSLEHSNKNLGSPLKNELRDLANSISRIGTIGALLVMVSYLVSVIIIANDFEWGYIAEVMTRPKIIFGHIIYALTLGATITIVSVPEGLPMMVALMHSFTTEKLFKNNVLIRRMARITTLGSISTLFIDKTGPLTKGNMDVVGVVLYDGTVLNNLEDFKKVPKISKHILENLTLNNETILDTDGRVLGGSTVDRALLDFVKGYKSETKIIDQKYFSSKDRYSSIKIDDGHIHELIKGDPDVLIPKIKEVYNSFGRREYVFASTLKSTLDKYTKLGYKVILLADKLNDSDDSLIFISYILLKDELRENVKETIDFIESANIHIVMITEDSLDTAFNIGNEIGLLKESSDVVLTSADFKKMSDEDIKKIYKNIKVVCGAQPEDRIRLVKIGQSLGEVVGMTGCAVVDVPVIRCADVGFAMGSGCEVVKRESDVEILDDDLFSMGKSILYGRTIVKNIRKFIIFQLTLNLCTFIVSIVGPFLNIATPIIVMQMLYVNMIIGTLVGVAFSFSPPLLDYIKCNPLKKEEPMINRYMYSSIFVTGIYISILLLLFLKLPVFTNLFSPDIENHHLMTAFVGLFVFAGLMIALSSRTDRLNILSNITKDRPFIFTGLFIMVIEMIILLNGTYSLTFKEFLVIFVLAISILLLDLVRKWVLRKMKYESSI